MRFRKRGTFPGREVASDSLCRQLRMEIANQPVALTMSVV